MFDGQSLASVLQGHFDISSPNPKYSSRQKLKIDQPLPSGTRSTVWKILLGYLPCFEPHCEDVAPDETGYWNLKWAETVTAKRNAYRKLLRRHHIHDLTLAGMDKPKTADAIANKKLYRQVWQCIPIAI